MEKSLSSILFSFSVLYKLFQALNWYIPFKKAKSNYGFWHFLFLFIFIVRKSFFSLKIHHVFSFVVVTNFDMFSFHINFIFIEIIEWIERSISYGQHVYRIALTMGSIWKWWKVRNSIELYFCSKLRIEAIVASIAKHTEKREKRSNFSLLI